MQNLLENPLIATHTEPHAEPRFLNIFTSLGFACLCAWELTMMFAPVLPITSFATVEQSLWPYVASIAAGLLTLLVAYKARRFVLRRHTLLFVASLPLCLAPIIASAAGHATELVTNVVFVGIWIALGIGQAMLILSWILLIRSHLSKRAAQVVAGGSCLGTVFFILVACIKEPVINLLGTALLLAAAADAYRLLATSIQSKNATAPKAEMPLQKSAPRKDYNADASSLRMGALAEMLNSNVYGFILIALFSFGLVPSLLAAAAGLLGALSAYMLSSHQRFAPMDMRKICLITTPCIVACLLLIPFFEEHIQIALCCIINIAHAFYRTANAGIIATPNTGYDKSNIHGLYAAKQSIAGRIPVLAGLILGASMGTLVFFVSHVSGQTFSFLMVLYVIVLLTVVFSGELFWSADNKMRCPATQNSQNTASEIQLLDGHSDKYCDDKIAGEKDVSALELLETIAQEFQLSPRETEVFALLAKGRNAKHIQEALTLAPGTVRTHIHHVYQKVGANTQQHIIDIAESKQKRF